MTRRFHTAKPAAEELVAAIHWYEERRAGLGGDFYDAIVRTMDRIAEIPEGGSPLGQPGARRMLVAGFPYQIVYSLEVDEVRVIAFAHLKRRPGFWRRRR